MNWTTRKVLMHGVAITMGVIHAVEVLEKRR